MQHYHQHYIYGHVKQVNEGAEISHACKESNLSYKWTISQTKSLSEMVIFIIPSFHNWKQIFLLFSLPFNFSFSPCQWLLCVVWATFLSTVKSSECKTEGCSRNTTGTECQFHFLHYCFLSMSQALAPCFPTCTEHGTAPFCMKATFC